MPRLCRIATGFADRSALRWSADPEWAATRWRTALRTAWTSPSPMAPRDVRVLVDREAVKPEERAWYGRPWTGARRARTRPI